MERAKYFLVGLLLLVQLGFCSTLFAATLRLNGSLPLRAHSPAHNVDAIANDGWKTRILVPQRDIPTWSSLFADRKTGLLSHTLSAVVEAPLSMVSWDKADWEMAVVLGATTVTFMMPLNPSLDARLQDAVVQTRTPFLDVVFPHITSEDLSYIAAAGVLITAGLGLAAKDEKLVDYSAVLFESMATASMLHIAMKLTMGREGPTQGHGNGEIHGPSQGPELFPSGTPSGHSAAVWAAVGATVTYLDNPILTAAGLTSCGYMTASLMYNNQHFISDIIWGGPMGYFIGRWVAKQRAAAEVYGEANASRFFDPKLQGIIPWGDNPLGAQGLSMLYTW
jgi:membrane-associated phospholipid phosphatase